MRIKTSIIIGLAIATILTAYISGPTLSNQAFAQHPCPCCPGCGGPIVAQGNDNSQGNEAGGGATAHHGGNGHNGGN